MHQGQRVNVSLIRKCAYMESSLQLLTLSCEACGAPLQVKPETHVITCRYCGSQLSIHQEGGTLSTQALQSIGQNPSQAASSGTIKAFGTAASCMMMGTSITGGVIWMIVSGFIATMAYKMGVPRIIFALPLFGLFFIGFGVATGIVAIRGTSKMAKLAEERENKRQAIVGEIEKHKKTLAQNSDTVENMTS